MILKQIRVFVLILILNIAIECYGFRKKDAYSRSVNGPNEDSPKGLQVPSCGNNNLGKVVGVYLTDCNAPPCTFDRKKKYNYFLQFSLDEDHAYLDANFESSLFGIKTPLNVLSGDVCGKLLDDKKCPLKKGETYVLHVVVEVDKVMPSEYGRLLSAANIELKINLELKDPVKGNKFCIVLDARIK